VYEINDFEQITHRISETVRDRANVINKEVECALSIGTKMINDLG